MASGRAFCTAPVPMSAIVEAVLTGCLTASTMPPTKLAADSGALEIARVRAPRSSFTTAGATSLARRLRPTLAAGRVASNRFLPAISEPLQNLIAGHAVGAHGFL